MTVSVGITGHRALPSDPKVMRRIVRQVEDVLDTIRREVETIATECARPDKQGIYTNEAPRFVLVSSLAAGADCLVAQTAIDQGYELQVPLPMDTMDYQNDFDDDSYALFNKLLHHEQCTSVFTIEAADPERGHAYTDASRVMLNHSDIVIALWDGQNTGYVAGTAPTLDMAAARHIPALHILADKSPERIAEERDDAPPPIQLLNDGFQTPKWKEGIRSYLRSILLPQEAAESVNSLHFAQLCAQQKPIRFKWVPNLEKWVERIMGIAPPHIKLERAQAEREDSGAAVWRQPYHWFDKLSNIYSVRYRCCLVLRFAAPVAAIIFLILGLNWHPWFGAPEPQSTPSGFDLLLAFFFASQVLLLGFTIFLEHMDRRVLWHKRFFSYRVVSELFRQSRFLWESGYCNVRNKARTYVGNQHRWTSWYYRAMVRHHGLPNQTININFLRQWLQELRQEFILGQKRYHLNRNKRESNLSTKLFACGVALFLFGMTASAFRGYLAAQGSDPSTLPLTIAGAAAVVLPSLAVFCTGFCGYAGYPKNQQVSYEEYNCLNSINREIELLLGINSTEGNDQSYILPGELHFGHAYHIAARVHDCCNEELMDWEELISSKGIKFN